MLGTFVILIILSCTEPGQSQNDLKIINDKGGWESLGLPPVISESFRKNLVKALLQEKEIILLNLRQSEDGEDGLDEDGPEPAGTFDVLSGLYGVVSGLATFNSTRVFQSAVNFFPPVERPAAQLGVDVLIQMFGSNNRPQQQNQTSLPERLSNAFVNVISSNITLNPNQNVTVNRLAPIVIDAVVSAFNDSMNDRAVIVRPIMEMLINGLMQFPSVFDIPITTQRIGGVIPRRSTTTLRPPRRRPTTSTGPSIPSIHVSFPYPHPQQPLPQVSSTLTSTSLPVSIAVKLPSSNSIPSSAEDPNEIDTDADVIIFPMESATTTMQSVPMKKIPNNVDSQLQSQLSLPFSPSKFIETSRPRFPISPGQLLNQRYPQSPITDKNNNLIHKEALLTLSSGNSSRNRYPSTSTLTPVYNNNNNEQSVIRNICIKNRCFQVNTTANGNIYSKIPNQVE